MEGMTILHDLVAEQGYILLDGATGTELFKRGLEAGYPPELWNVEQPELVAETYRAYVDAGSDLILTNSFGGTRFRLALHNSQDRVVELNQAAARIAREVADAAMAADEGRTVIVAGSMGPTGELMEPMGSLTPEDCRAAFAEQAEGLAAGGADVLWLETLSSLDELENAVLGAQEGADLPVCATMSFDTAGRTMMGVDGAAAAELATKLGLAAIGANCGNNLADTEAAVVQMRNTNPEILLISKGNAGIPEWHGTELRYNGTPDLMAAYADRARGVGAALIGGCCGSTPDHISRMKQILSGAAPVPEVEEVAGSTQAPAAGSRRRSSRRRTSS